MSISDLWLWLNRVAQGSIPIDEAIAVMRNSTDAEFPHYMRGVGEMAMSAGFRNEDIPAAALLARVRIGAPACVILSKGTSRGYMDKVTSLRRQDSAQTFRFLLALFQVADRRRRETRCAHGCTHWWHLDLGDAVVVAGLNTQWARGRVGESSTESTDRHARIVIARQP